ncbi:MAG: type II secretion system protein GspG, partial [Chthoniobacterales bacterium]
DFQMITTQLRAYEMMNLSLPSTSQGLEALVKRPGGEPAPRRWIQLFERVPLDPWNKPYQYSNPGKLNPRGFDLVSMGPDGQLGTEDDINNKPASAN